MILEAIAEARSLGARLGPCCKLIGIDVRTIQRWLKHGPEGGEDRRRGPNTAPENALTETEREQIVELVTSSEYRDLPVSQIVPILADLGIYVASESSIYRLLKRSKMNTHRGRKRPPKRRRPDEHKATGPCQVWAWDITYLRSPVRGQFYYLYLFMDVWSRMIVGWAVHDREDNELSAETFLEICRTHGIDPEGLVLHSDNGPAMKGATMTATLEKLGVIRSFSRPRVSDDNAFVESLFGTQKTRPNYPSGPFKDLEAARAWVAEFVLWYNEEHRHSGISFVTPLQRHTGVHLQLLAHRRRVYAKARRRHPNRWTGNTRSWKAHPVVRLNPRTKTQAAQTTGQS